MSRTRVFVLATVVLLHGLLLTGFWYASARLPRHDESALEVRLLSEPLAAHELEPPPMPARLIVSAPAVSVDPLPAMQLPAADAPTAPLIASSPAPTPSSSPTDVTRTLGTELAIQCPERTAPRYPPLAKRQREQGEVQLRVELDERGRIDSVRIVSSSGSPRLDEAARMAVESWRCRPAQHDGRPVRAVALQSLAFVLERH